MMSLTRRLPVRFAFLLALLGAGAFTAWPAGAPERRPPRHAPIAAEGEARVIVKYKADAALMRAAAPSATPPRPQHAKALGARLGMALADGRTIGDRAQVLKAQGLTSRALADQLAAQPDVEYAVVDGRVHALAVPNDPLFPNDLANATPAVGQWYLRAPTSSTIVDATSIVSAINAQGAWDVTQGDAGTVVAVLDTGVRFDHPDLAGKLLAGYDFVGFGNAAGSVGVANDGDGADADPSDPGDWITQTEANTSGGPFFHCGDQDNSGAYIGSNSSWHGTQTAGLIGAATNNVVGMAGTGYNVKVLPVRVLGKCGGYDSDIQAAMLWVASREAGSPASAMPRAKVINMSLGGVGACNASYQSVFNQVNDAGVSVVVSAGNDGLAVATPANCPHAIAVAGVRHVGTKVGYSDLGPEVSIAAPAGNCVNATGTCLFPILTTSNSGTTTPVAGPGGAIYTDGGANASLGTSFSAPMVSGTVALMLSANPTLTPSQVLSALKATARPFPATGAGAGVTACTAPSSTAQSSECYCTTTTCGAGLLDAGAAVQSVATSVPTATIAVASTSATAGTAVTLDASTSRGSTGATVATYAWSVTSGPATITSASNAASVTVLPSAAGSVVVGLVVTDTLGKQASASVTLTVAAAPIATPPATSSGGGGGGAMQPGWLLALLAATLALRVTTPRRR